MYPDELIDDLIAETGLDSTSRALEIGCGTGKLTRSLVARGLDVTCVEPGANLAAVAQRIVPDARIVVARFEDWTPDDTYDVIACATAWHWLDPAVAPAKAHRLLRTGGTLAVIGTHHVIPHDADPFFIRMQEAYRAIGEGVDEFPGPEDIRHDDAVALRATGLFDVRDLAYLRVIEYDADSYIDVLNTYSGHIAMTDDERATIFDGVRRFAGDEKIRKHHLFCLHLATKIG